MRWLVLAVLMSLAAALPARAQTVTLNICNAGTVEIDVFTQLETRPTRSSTIKPSACGAVATAGEDGMQAYLGLAFTDSRGQWGAPQRFESLPNMGVRPIPLAVGVAAALRGQVIPAQPKIVSAADKEATVRHAGVFSVVPMQLFFRPAFPTCRSVPTGRSTSSFVGGREETTSEYEKVCENYSYTLIVEPHTDSHEASLGSLPVGGGFKDARQPRSGEIEKTTQIDWAHIAADKKRRDAPASLNLARQVRPVGSAPLGPPATASPPREQTSTQNPAPPTSVAPAPLAAGVQSVAAFQPSWIGKQMKVIGTVSRFVQRNVKGEKYVYLYFKERPDSTVVACSRDDNWLLGVLGVDDFKSVVGTTIEFSGDIVNGTCTVQGAGLWIWERHQARIIGGPAR
jgi:hypothetical protein